MRTRKIGFTLVELLVVIAIIAMLVTLLLPAVQSAREAARRAQCQNNLRNLALACLNYESASQKFPPSYTPGPCCGTPSYESWTIGILPYIEEQALHDIYNFDIPNDCSDGDAACQISNKRVRETILPIHICPSDEGTDQLSSPESGNGSGQLYARGTYRGNAGRSNGNGMWWDAQQGTSGLPAGWKGPLTTSCGPEELWDKPGSNASFCSSSADAYRGEVRMRNIADGTSKTLLIGEQTMKPTSESARRRRTFWAYTYTSYNKSEVVPETRSMFSDYDRCVQFGDSNVCKRAWGTAHVNGTIQFAHADGSVTGYPPNVDMQAFAAAASINGQEAISGNGG